MTEEAGLSGAGSTVLPGRVIGRDALVGAGATVTKDVLDASIVVGCPAQPAGRMVVERTMQRHTGHRLLAVQWAHLVT